MTSRLEHPLYRCFACGSLITALEIISMWEEAEKANPVIERKGLCACGSGKIQPTNLNHDETEKFMSDEQRDRLLAGIDDHYTRVWKQALWSIFSGEAVECSDEERELAKTYWQGRV